MPFSLFPTSRARTHSLIRIRLRSAFEFDHDLSVHCLIVLQLILSRIESDRGDSMPDKMTLNKVFHHLGDWTIWAYGNLNRFRIFYNIVISQHINFSADVHEFNSASVRHRYQSPVKISKAVFLPQSSRILSYRYTAVYGVECTRRIPPLFPSLCFRRKFCSLFLCFPI